MIKTAVQPYVKGPDGWFGGTNGNRRDSSPQIRGNRR